MSQVENKQGASGENSGSKTIKNDPYIGIETGGALRGEKKNPS